MAVFSRCPECLIGKVPVGGRCDYCVRIRSTVEPGRAPMGPALRAMTVALLGSAVVAVVWAGLYGWRYVLMADLKDGDFSGRDAFLLTNHLTVAGVLVLAVANLLVSVRSRRWTRVGHANALTQPALGLRWLRTLPKSRRLTAWKVGTVACWLGLVLPRFVSRSDANPGDVQLIALVEIAAAVASVVVCMAQIRAARAATAELEATLDRLEGDGSVLGAAGVGVSAVGADDR